jgi:hypothetical protein
MGTGKYSERPYGLELNGIKPYLILHEWEGICVYSSTVSLFSLWQKFQPPMVRSATYHCGLST